MKYLILSIFISFNIFAQKSEVFKLDSLPPDGVLLNKGWKWHAGDNPEWAKADFDDSNWDDINPALNIPDLENINTKQPLWLRLKLKNTTSNNIILTRCTV